MIALALLQIVSGLDSGTGGGVTPADVQSAIVAATPATCGTPQSDTYTGTAGSGVRCMPREDNARRTQVQSATATTASDGTFSGNWAAAFASVPMYAHAEINSANTPFVCSIITTTAIGYTGKCFAVASTTLPGTLLALNGLVVSPIVNASAGQAVRIIARQ